MTATITRILVPMDFSAHSHMALRYATTLARRFGAAVELLHVVDDAFATGAWGFEAYVPNLAEVQEQLIAEAESRLAECRATVRDQGIHAAAIVRNGPTAVTIVGYAKALGADLIVMGTHGRTGFTHLVMGSVAERVVRMAPCRVLTVRETPAGAEGEQAASDAAA
jgi:nucleotide-binding universal stress UspA family protein